MQLVSIPRHICRMFKGDPKAEPEFTTYQSKNVKSLESAHIPDDKAYDMGFLIERIQRLQTWLGSRESERFLNFLNSSLDDAPFSGGVSTSKLFEHIDVLEMAKGYKPCKLLLHPVVMRELTTVVLKNNPDFEHVVANSVSEIGVVGHYKNLTLVRHEDIPKNRALVSGTRSAEDLRLHPEEKDLIMTVLDEPEISITESQIKISERYNFFVYPGSVVMLPVIAG